MSYYWYIWNVELRAAADDFGILINIMEPAMKKDMLGLLNEDNYDYLYGITELKRRAFTYDSDTINNLWWFKDIMLFLSKYKVIGFFHLWGEEGQHVKHVLDGKGNVREHQCEYVFNDQKGKMLVNRDSLKQIIIKYYDRALTHENGNVNYWGDQADGFHALAYALFPDQFDRIKESVIRRRNKNG